MRTFFANLAQHGLGMSAMVGSPGSEMPENDENASSILLNSPGSRGAWSLSRQYSRTSNNAADGELNRVSVDIQQPFGLRTFARALDEIMAFTAIPMHSRN